MPVTLTDEQFALLYEVLDRQSQSSFDPKFVGHTVKKREKLFAEVKRIAKEQGFTVGPPRPARAHTAS